MTGSLVFDYLHKFHESNPASVDTAVETQFVVEMIVYNRDLQSNLKTFSLICNVINFYRRNFIILIYNRCRTLISIHWKVVLERISSFCNFSDWTFDAWNGYW